MVNRPFICLIAWHLQGIVQRLASRRLVTEEKPLK